MHASAISIFALSGLLSFSSAQLANSSVPSECSAICAPIVQLTETCDVTSDSSMSMSSMMSMASSMSMSMSMGTSGSMTMSMPMTTTSTGNSAAATGNIIEMYVDMMKRRAQMSGMEGMDMSGMTDAEMAEMMCICENTSFDVKSVMGLCASCMGMNAGSGNKTAVEMIDKVMSECSFPTTTYASSATSILAGVSVQATKPVVTSGMATSTGMAMGPAGRVEVVAGVWGAGMIMGGIGLGTGMFFGML